MSEKGLEDKEIGYFLQLKVRLKPVQNARNIKKRKKSNKSETFYDVEVLT